MIVNTNLRMKGKILSSTNKEIVNTVTVDNLSNLRTETINSMNVSETHTITHDPDVNYTRSLQIYYWDAINSHWILTKSDDFEVKMISSTETIIVKNLDGIHNIKVNMVL
jgi:hypothetical protein